MRVSAHSGYSALPTEAAVVFEDPLSESLLRSRIWLQNAEANGLRPGDRTRLYLTRDADGRVLALLPAVYSRSFAGHPGARVLNFTFPEDQDFVPLLVDADVDVGDVTTALFDSLRASAPSYDVIRIGPLPAGSPFAARLADGLRRTGHLIQVYRHRPARFATLDGQSFQDYMAQRPRALRESLDRNRRLMFDSGRARFHFPCTRNMFEFSGKDIQRVIGATPTSGEPEPPGYLSSMMALAADCRALRIGMLYLNEQPLAMQFWVVSGGVAHCLRIWSAQGPQPFPVDDVLTQMVLVCLIDGDRVTELNFGAVEDESASHWAPMEHDRVGIAAFTPRTWRGLRGAARHVLPNVLSDLLARLSGRAGRTRR